MPIWQRQIKEYLTFSKKERNGIFVLLLLLTVLLVTNLILPWFITNQPSDFSDFEKQITLFESQQSGNTNKSSGKSQTAFEDVNTNEVKLTPFMFNPNDLPADEWQKLGLTEKQVNVILNYRNKGGRFREKQDFAKIYSISEQEYKILEPYISIEPASYGANKKFDSKTTINPFPFDPNTITAEQAEELGLHESVVNAIIKYREKGGRFKSSSDLGKIYTLTKEEYAILEPFVRISNDTSLSLPAKTKVVVELNSADSLDLQQLQGIGPSFSKRIIKYRDLLGGFYSAEQLREVYGMDSIRYRGIAGQVIVDNEKIRKININKVSIKEMTKHPYIEFYVAKSIINYRNEKGTFSDVKQIKEAKLVYTELYLKIEPYLSVN